MSAFRGRADQARMGPRSRLLPSRPGESHPEPLTGRVEGWRAGRPFDRATFPVPATSHAACGFPALRAPICFIPRLMGPIPLGQLSVSVASHSIAVVQPESVVQPRPIPPLPAEALSFPSMRQMAPDLLLNPIFDVAEALTGVSNREVVHPTPEHRIDQAYHPVNRLRPVSAKHLFELAQKRRSLFELGRIMRPHHSA